MIVAVHEKEGKTIVAVCDDDLIGQALEEGEKQLNLGADFFKGKQMTDAEAGDIIRNADSVNLVGQQSVALGIKEGLIDDTNISHIREIPYALGVVLKD